MALNTMISESAYDAANPNHYESNYAGKPLFMARTHEGLVLETYERNGYDDSDFVAVIWNPVEGKPVNVTYATTRFWTYPNSATVDATSEVREAYNAYRAAAAAEKARARAEAEAADPAVKGRTVTVTRGRKVPKGTTGEVFWVGTCRYSRKPRIGLKDADGEVHWVLADYCKVVR
jgi:hypothetical protein